MEFDMKDLGEASRIPGINIRRDGKKKQLSLDRSSRRISTNIYESLSLAPPFSSSLLAVTTIGVLLIRSCGGMPSIDPRVKTFLHI